MSPSRTSLRLARPRLSAVTIGIGRASCSSRRLGATEDKRRLWSWVILKAYTSNHHGTVRLRTASPFDVPEICFDSFNERAEKNRPLFEARRQTAVADCDDLLWAGKALPQCLIDERKQAEAEWAENERRLADSKRDLARTRRCGLIHAAGQRP